MKQIIGIDIDDVLAANAEGFVKFSNERWGMHLRPEDYKEHWAEVWKVDLKEFERRAIELHDSGVIATYRHNDAALPVLQELKQSYILLAMTSRQLVSEQLTRDWMEKHYKGIFDDIKFTGIFDGPLDLSLHLRTKSDLFTEHKVTYVIDDQLKHCLAAAELGIDTLLFSNYTWNQTDEALPEKVVQVSDWQAVLEYFRAQ